MDLKRQELIVILVSGKIKGEIFALGVCSHEEAEEEDDLVDVKHPSGRALIPSGPYIGGSRGILLYSQEYPTILVYFYVDMYIYLYI